MQQEFKPGDPAPWPLPSFIRCLGYIDDLCGQPFDCWDPDVTGHPATDYEAGQRYCQATIDLAREFASPLLLVNVLSAMRRKAPGTIEAGFLDVLARKAATGASPGDFPSGPYFQPDEQFRHAERVADAYLKIARGKDGFVTIACLLSDFMNGEVGESAGPYLLKICGAAMNAGEN